MAELSNDKLAEIINSGFEAQREFMEHTFPTHDDVDKKIDTHTQLLTATIEKLQLNVTGRFDRVDEHLDAIDVRLDAIEKRTNEDTTLALKEVASLKKQMQFLIAHVERTTGEKVQM